MVPHKRESIYPLGSNLAGNSTADSRDNISRLPSKCCKKIKRLEASLAVTIALILSNTPAKARTLDHFLEF